MTLLVDTRAVTAPERAGFWAEELNGVYSPLRVETDRGEGFQARMWGESLGGVGLFRITASPHSMHRTPADIVAGDPQSVFVSVLLRGALSGSQHGREFALAPGDIVAHDSAHPSSRWATEPFDLLVIRVPMTALGSRAAGVERRMAMRLCGEDGVPRAARRFFCGTAAGLADGSISRDDRSLSEIVADLARRLLDDVPELPGGRPRTRAQVLQRARSYIESHLGDPELDPEQIARACSISRRHLHAVFADEGRSVSCVIREARLDRCHRDLLDPALADQPIAAIAERWGLPSAPHFSRIFRAAYHCSPRELRRGG